MWFSVYCLVIWVCIEMRFCVLLCAVFYCVLLFVFHFVLPCFCIVTYFDLHCHVFWSVLPCVLVYITMYFGSYFRVIFSVFLCLCGQHCHVLYCVFNPMCGWLPTSCVYTVLYKTIFTSLHNILQLFGYMLMLWHVWPTYVVIWFGWWYCLYSQHVMFLHYVVEGYVVC